MPLSIVLRKPMETCAQSASMPGNNKNPTTRTNILRKQSTLNDAQLVSPSEDSMLMTYFFSEMGSASDWSRRKENLLQPIRSTRKWCVINTEFLPLTQKLICEETSASVAKCRFSQVDVHLYEQRCSVVPFEAVESMLGLGRNWALRRGGLGWPEPCCQNSHYEIHAHKINLKNQENSILIPWSIKPFCNKQKQQHHKTENPSCKEMYLIIGDMLSKLVICWLW